VARLLGGYLHFSVARNPLFLFLSEKITVRLHNTRNREGIPIVGIESLRVKSNFGFDGFELDLNLRIRTPVLRMVSNQVCGFGFGFLSAMLDPVLDLIRCILILQFESQV